MVCVEVNLVVLVEVFELLEVGFELLLALMEVGVIVAGNNVRGRVLVGVFVLLSVVLFLLEALFEASLVM